MLKQHLEFAIGQDFSGTFYCFTGNIVKLSSDVNVGNTTLNCYPLSAALSTGTKLLFGSLIVTLSDDAPAMATSIEVTAVESSIYSSVIGKELQNLSGFDLQFEVRDDALAVAIDPNDVDVVIAGDGYSATLTGRCGLDVSKGYSWSVWRRDTGFQHPLAGGDLTVYYAGFTA